VRSKGATPGVWSPTSRRRRASPASLAEVEEEAQVSWEEEEGEEARVSELVDARAARA
jgi:hypothetical protein